MFVRFSINIISMILLISHTVFAQKNFSVTSPPLTIVTYNIANYMDIPNWPERLELLAQAIENVHANIIVLQETRFNPDEPTTQIDYENMAEQLLRKLNEHGDFLNAQLVNQPAMYYPIDNTHKNSHNYSLPSSLSPTHLPYYWEGLSIISKAKITETGSYFLSQPPGCNDNNKRITQYIKFDQDGQPFFVLNAHFGLGTVCLAANVKETVNYAQQLTKTAPLLLVGDLNTTPDDSVLNPLRQMGLQDLWLMLHPDDKGYTFPSTAPIKRIDYMWANSALVAKLNQNTKIQLIGSEPRNGIYASDHLGVALTL